MKTNVSNQIEAPWQEKGIQPIVKMTAVFTIIAILFFGLLPTVSNLIIAPIMTGQSLWAGLASMLLGLLIVAGLLLGVKKLWRYAAGPSDSKLKSTTLMAQELGDSFAVRFDRLRSTRTFNGTGSARFTETHMVCYGTMEPSIVYQLGIIVVVTLIPYVLFGVGLGLIPALLIAYYTGRKEMARYIKYEEIQSFSLKGRSANVRCSGEFPNRVKFRVAPHDGERLYHELFIHYPEPVSFWNSELQNRFGIEKEAVLLATT